jgi:hypothetical protein
VLNAQLRQKRPLKFGDCAMAHLTLTKSKTSRISRLQTKSPIKKSSFDFKSRRIIDSSTKPEKEDQPSAQTPKLEILRNHLSAGYPPKRGLMIDDELVISDVLAGIKYLMSIQFPPFPEKGLGRDRIADLHNARKVLSLKTRAE